MMEQNYSENLRNEPIASVKSILDYAYDRLEELEDESKLDTKESDYYTKAISYWKEVTYDCIEELQLRIKQIFPI